VVGGAARLRVPAPPLPVLPAPLGRAGPRLAAALFFGLLCGAALGLVATQRAASGAPAEADALARRLAGRAALAWTVALALGLAPIARYWLVTGGASLFGGAS
jgi:hypothetical protein